MLQLRYALATERKKKILSCRGVGSKQGSGRRNRPGDEQKRKEKKPRADSKEETGPDGTFFTSREEAGGPNVKETGGRIKRSLPRIPPTFLSSFSSQLQFPSLSSAVARQASHQVRASEASTNAGGSGAMRLLVPDGARRQRLLQCEAPPSPSPPSPSPYPSSSPSRTVVVGIRRDAASRELLTWALVKVANAGDRVVALHVATAAAADGTAHRPLFLLTPD